MSPRTRLTSENILDISSLQEKEFNDFFGVTVITGTETETELTTTFLPYLAGRNFVRSSNDITVTSGTDFVTIGRQFVADRVSDETTTSTDSTAFILKVQLVTSNLPAGDYKLSWYYEWNYDTIVRDFQARIVFDSAVVLMEHRQEPQEDDSDQWAPASGMVFGTVGAGVHTIDLEYAASNGIDLASIRRARLLLESL